MLLVDFVCGWGLFVAFSLARQSDAIPPAQHVVAIA
jgi:hypothetical protein